MVSGRIMMDRRSYRIADKYAPINGMTISTKSSLSKEATVTYFMLAAGTDISPEAYPETRLYIVNEGEGIFATGINSRLRIREGEMLAVPGGTLCGVSTENGLVYTEVIPGKDVKMNDIIKAGEVFEIVDKIPYKQGSIVNLDVASNENMKYVLMAFDEGTGLTPHSAPGDAIVFALEGRAIIGYEGQDFPIKAGEQFRFDKGGVHSVTADGKFKMALLLILG